MNIATKFVDGTRDFQRVINNGYNTTEQQIHNTLQSCQKVVHVPDLWCLCNRYETIKIDQNCDHCYRKLKEVDRYDFETYNFK